MLLVVRHAGFNSPRPPSLVRTRPPEESVSAKARAHSSSVSTSSPLPESLSIDLNSRYMIFWSTLDPETSVSSIFPFLFLSYCAIIWLNGGAGSPAGSIVYTEPSRITGDDAGPTVTPRAHHKRSPVEA